MTEANLDSRLRVALPNPSPHMLLMHRLQAAARDQALHGIQQFHPILQRWVGYRLPLIEPFLALEEIPFAAHALGLDLEFFSVLRPPFPTDLSLGHDD